MVEADLYDQADVAVVGAGNSAGQAVMFLSECCPNRRVHLLIRRTLGPGMSSYLVESHPRRRTSSSTNRPKSNRCMATATSKRSKSKTKNRARPTSALRRRLRLHRRRTGRRLASRQRIAKDANGYLLTGPDAFRSGAWPCPDREPCPLETTVPGILAAGDIRAGATKRVGFAVGDGSLAVTCVHRLLSIQY